MTNACENEGESLLRRCYGGQRKKREFKCALSLSFSLSFCSLIILSESIPERDHLCHNFLKYCDVKWGI